MMALGVKFSCRKVWVTKSLLKDYYSALLDSEKKGISRASKHKSGNSTISARTTKLCRQKTTSYVTISSSSSLASSSPKVNTLSHPPTSKSPIPHHQVLQPNRYRHQQRQWAHLLRASCKPLLPKLLRIWVAAGTRRNPHILET